MLQSSSLEVTLQAPSSVGSCSVMFLVASGSGAVGCNGDVVFDWEIDFADPSGMFEYTMLRTC